MEWKDIVGYEGYYQVSDTGLVRSVDRYVTNSKGKTCFLKGKLLKPLFTSYGYATTGLYNRDKIRRVSNHRLVYEAFVGPLIKGMHIDHINHDHTDNRVENLQQITHRENLTKDIWRRSPSSSYVGVYWCKQTKKWRAAITIGKKKKHLGRFDNEFDAHKAYQHKLTQLKQ